MNTGIDSNINETDRNNKIENMLIFLNTYTPRHNPLVKVKNIHNAIRNGIDKLCNLSYPVNLSTYPKYVWNDVSTLYIIGSKDNYSLIVVPRRAIQCKSVNDCGIIINNILYHCPDKVYQRSFNIIDEKLVLGDITETKYEDLLDILYKLPNVERVIQAHMIHERIKKCIPEDRDIKLLFDNDVSIEISEILLSTYSPVYNMLHYRDSRFTSEQKVKLKGIWHIPGNPTPHVAQLIKDQLASNWTQIKEKLSFDDLNSYIEIFQYLGLTYDPDS